MTDLVADTNPLRADRAHAQEAFSSAVASVAASGVGRKSFILGVWQAAIGILLSAGEPSDVIDCLVDRAGTIRGQGRNADAPPLDLDSETLNRRGVESRIAAEVIVSHLEPLLQQMQNADREDAFPEAVFDAALQILVGVWGPAHTRRILREQVEAIDGGDARPILPREPSAPNHVPRAARPAAQQAEVPSAPQAAPAPIAVPRSIEVIVTADVEQGAGASAYAVVMRIEALEGSHRCEIREVCGVVPGDRTGRAAHIRGCTDALLSVGATGPRDMVRFHTTSEDVVQGMMPASGRNPRARLASEAALWEALDLAAAGRRVSWSQGRLSMANPLASRCDRALRAGLQEAERIGS